MVMTLLLLAAAGTAAPAGAQRSVPWPGPGIGTSSLLPSVGDGRLRSADSSVVRPAAAFPAPRVRAWQVGLARPDRLEHASLSFTLAAALIVASRSHAVAASATFALGVGKELWDARGGSGFEATDAAADATGIALAIVCVRARER